MALERRNPVPPGRYWLDVFGDNRSLFMQWLKAANSDSAGNFVDNVVPVKYEQYPDEGAGRDWHLLEVKRPVAWNAVLFGYPTIAGGNVHTSEDTIIAPPPVEQPTLPEALERSAKTVASVLAIGAGLWALSILSRFVGRR